MKKDLWNVSFIASMLFFDIEHSYYVQKDLFSKIDMLKWNQIKIDVLLGSFYVFDHF